MYWELTFTDKLPAGKATGDVTYEVKVIGDRLICLDPHDWTVLSVGHLHYWILPFAKSPEAVFREEWLPSPGDEAELGNGTAYVP